MIYLSDPYPISMLICMALLIQMILSVFKIFANKHKSFKNARLLSFKMLNYDGKTFTLKKGA